MFCGAAHKAVRVCTLRGGEHAIALRHVCRPQPKPAHDGAHWNGQAASELGIPYFGTAHPICPRLVPFRFYPFAELHRTVCSAGDRKSRRCAYVANSRVLQRPIRAVHLLGVGTAKRSGRTRIFHRHCTSPQSCRLDLLHRQSGHASRGPGLCSTLIDSDVAVMCVPCGSPIRNSHSNLRAVHA